MLAHHHGFVACDVVFVEEDIMLTPMQKGRENKILDTKYNYGNEVKTEREFIHDAILCGLCIRTRDNVLVGKAVARTVYEVVDDAGIMIDISKTAYDYSIRQRGTK